MSDYPEDKLSDNRGGHIDNGYPQDMFDNAYWTYEDTTYPTARIDRSADLVILYFETLFSIVGEKEPNIVDVGAGAGNFVNQFRKVKYNAVGCEYSESGRKLAKERFGVDLSYGDLRNKLPYETDQFNWAMCAGVLSMIPKQYMRNAISEILRITKYGVLLTVGTSVDVNAENRDGNRHHITAMSCSEYYKLITNECGGYDWTSILPPQNAAFGIGTNIDEYGGLISKSRYPF